MESTGGRARVRENPKGLRPTIREPAEGGEGFRPEALEGEALPPEGVEVAGLLLEVAEGLPPEAGAGSLPSPLRRRAVHADSRSPRGTGR